MAVDGDLLLFIRSAIGSVWAVESLVLLRKQAGRAWTAEALAHREEFRGYNTVQVDSADEYAANCVEVNGRILIAEGHPRFAAKLRDLGYEMIALEMSEFQKMDGGLSCLSVRW